jgi:5'-deoxynucleotidase YfbR-like HD superfamily hydrolase
MSKNRDTTTAISPQLWRETLCKALLHDMEECRSGDLPRPFKFSRPELAKALDEASCFAMADVLTEWSEDKELLNHWLHWWKNAKTRDTLSGAIVAFADYLSCLSHIFQELEAGNFAMLDHTTDLEGYHAEFANETYRFIRPLVDEVRQLSEEIFGRARRLRAAGRESTCPTA